MHWSLPKKDCGFLNLNLRWTSLLNCTVRIPGTVHLRLGPVRCIKYRERSTNFNVSMHTLQYFLDREVHSSTQLASWGLQVPQPGKFLLVQRRSRRILASCSYTSLELEPRRLVHEMLTTSRDYRLTLSTSGCSFHVCEVILQILITSLWEDPVRMVFKPPTVETLCAVPIRLSRCVTFATWVSTVADFSNEPSA